MAEAIVKHDFNGHQVRQRLADNYVNLTDMAGVEGKLVADYLRLASTKAYVAALSEAMGIPIGELILNKNGDRSGTFAHPEIAMDCAQWISVPFRIWANRTLVKVVTSRSIALPPADVRIHNLHTALTGFGIDVNNPRYQQDIQDLVLDKILGATPVLSVSTESWAGVAEIAETMGYAVGLVGRNRSSLGKFVATFNFERSREKRLCNGTMRDINLYRETPELRAAIAEFMDAKVLADPRN